MGILREPRAPRARVALRRAARVAARADRADGRGAGVRRPGLHAAALGRGLRAAVPPVRHAAGAEPAGADRRHRSLLPGDRVGAPAGTRARVGRLPGDAVRVLHDDVAPRRGREHRSRAFRRGRDRRRRGDRSHRHACGGGGLPARSSRGAQRRGLAHAAAGQARDERRPRSVHGPVARVRARRPAPRGRWLADDRGLRRDRREPDPGRRAPRGAGRSARADHRVPRRRHDRGGRAAPDARQRRARSGSRPRWRCCAWLQTGRRRAHRSATTHSGGRPRT